MKSLLKVKLYEFRNNLPIEMSDVTSIVTEHINYTDTYSEKEIYSSLENLLEIHKYSKDVKTFLESVDTELSNTPLLYALKDVYYKLSRKQDKFLYEPVMTVIEQCINAPTEEQRKSLILNDLIIYDWIEEVKSLVYNITENPQLRSNLTSTGGIVEDVYSVVINSENGYLTYIDENWYLLNSDGISQTLLEYHITDTVTLKRLRLLEETVKIASFDKDTITYKIAENFNIVLNTKSKELFINNNSKEIETTLETLFQSPVVPFECKSYYPVINEAYTNLDKFANISVAKYIWNPVNKAFESIVFNFEGNFYQVRKNASGKSFLKYDNVMPLIENIKQELGADITFFFESVLSDELKRKINLDNQVKKLTESLEKIEESILLIKEEKELLAEDESVKKLYNSLLIKKHKTSEEIKKVKTELYSFN